ncbi:hypothetical protein ACFQL7_28560 [Halocatena marina]|uniref:Uncharacterized protein n=1 Tax=Halocatena marina TaxID=2934937 RepID=A0ABD5YWZ4_9EURY|nr:hypothetical protein [Halocatena marina]
MDVIDSPLLIGRDHRRTQQFLLFAVAVSIGASAFSSISLIPGVPFVWQFVYVLVAVAFGGAMINAYLNDGLFVSTLIAIALPVGWVLTAILAIGLGAFGYNSYVQAGIVLLIITAFSLGGGIGAFIVGASSRRIVTYMR